MIRRSNILLLIVMLTALLGQSMAAPLMHCEMSMMPVHAAIGQVTQTGQDEPMVEEQADCAHHQRSEPAVDSSDHCCSQNCHCASMGCASVAFVTSSHTLVMQPGATLKINLLINNKVKTRTQSVYRPPIFA